MVMVLLTRSQRPTHPSQTNMPKGLTVPYWTWRERCFQIFSTIRHKLWSESINTANYIRKRTHTTSCKEYKTLFEAIHDNPPNLAHLRVFGCDAYAHNTKQRWSNKFNDRSNKWILVGHDKGTAYRVYLTAHKDLVISKDVGFNEYFQPQQHMIIPRWNSTIST